MGEKAIPPVFAGAVMLGLVVCSLLAGCGQRIDRSPTATTRPAGADDPRTATVDYWLAQPAGAGVRAGELTVLWDACEDVARAWTFRIDRRDYRAGVLSTEPMVSRQVFEFWRRDGEKFPDAQEATLGTIRRTIFFQFSRGADGVYEVSPKVVVERHATVEPKYRDDPDMPVTYWYALRRDVLMEQRLAEDIRRRLSGERH